MLRQEILDWAKRKYSTEPEYLWAKYPDDCILRNKDGRWYALVMEVPRNKFGFDSNELVSVLNVKADMILIDLLVEQDGYYRAYHMNKNQWISILLDGTVPIDIIEHMIEESYEKTSKKKK
ncbi:MAG: MmcQ/YjbR family DNA-binding protein [Clostridia bacterium]|nr:MmcQ/YjbR family DNA-binding protein [Clostridia bacterium]